MVKSTTPIPFRPRASARVRRGAEPAPWSAPPGPPQGVPSEPGQPTDRQRAWLTRGLAQAGGKLPLFDADGQRIDPRTIRACIQNGWAQPWFLNPLKPDWLVCRLTDTGRAVAEGS